MSNDPYNAPALEEDCCAFLGCGVNWAEHPTADVYHDFVPGPCPGQTALCHYCGRRIVQEDGYWIDPKATGDDSIWRETCDAHDSFRAEHVPAWGTCTVRGCTSPAEGPSEGEMCEYHGDLVAAHHAGEHVTSWGGCPVCPEGSDADS